MINVENLWFVKKNTRISSAYMIALSLYYPLIKHQPFPLLQYFKWGLLEINLLWTPLQPAMANLSFH